MKKFYKPLIIVLVCLVSIRSFAQCGTATTIPYYEGFEGITTSNQLPTCWSASNPSVTCLTFTNNTGHTGVKSAGFYYSPAGDNYFYSEAIQLYAGVIYSASIWYNAGFNGGSDWTNLSILAGPNQSTIGLVTVASMNGPAMSNVYTALSNTFMVGSSGVYYMSVKGTHNGSGFTQYLLWDDLMVTVPCTGAGAANSPTITVSPSSATLCNGESATFTVTGADIYNASTNSVITTPTLNASNSMTIIGTKTLTGCSNMISIPITVNPSPNVSVIPSDPEICSGNTVNLTTIGAINYTIDGNPVTPPIILSPTVTTTYNIVGANSYSCTTASTLQIIVHPLPAVTVSNSAVDTACAGEQVILTGDGAVSYQWAASTGLLVGNTISVTPNTTITYSVTGTDVNGCSATTNYLLKVNACAGINQPVNVSHYAVYPNPFSGKFTVELNNGAVKIITVLDLVGRVIFSTRSEQDKTVINMRDFAHGMYYVKVQSANTTEFFEIIKEE